MLWNLEGALNVSKEIDNCEAQGKGKAWGQPRKKKEKKWMVDGGWWISFP